MLASKAKQPAQVGPSCFGQITILGNRHVCTAESSVIGRHHSRVADNCLFSIILPEDGKFRLVVKDAYLNEFWSIQLKDIISIDYDTEGLFHRVHCEGGTIVRFSIKNDKNNSFIKFFMNLHNTSANEIPIAGGGACVNDHSLKEAGVGAVNGTSELSCDSSHIFGLANILEKAIFSGNVAEAMYSAAVLAGQKVDCQVTVSSEAVQIPCEKEKEWNFIRLHFFVEDVHGRRIGPIKTRFIDTSSILDIKHKVYTDFYLPVKYQYWIFGNNIAEDHQNLKEFVETPGEVEASLYMAQDETPGRTGCLRSPNVDCDEHRHLQADDKKAVKNIELATPEVTSRQSPDYNQNEGWACNECTFINVPTRPGCEVCCAERPEEYEVPDSYRVDEELSQRDALTIQSLIEEEENKARIENFQRLKDAVENQSLILATEQFTCLICMENIAVGDGVVLQECLHNFCRDCLVQLINLNEEAKVGCPYQEGAVKCEEALLDREVKALVGDVRYAALHARSLREAELQAKDSFHCKTANCEGFCFYDDDVNEFYCELCDHTNCIPCNVIHERLNCKEYQDELKLKAVNDVDAKKTTDEVERMLGCGEAMKCPGCRIIIQKKGGCDWMQCRLCKTEICWVTRGPRWGPNGRGDNSGGCRCRIQGKKCDPGCVNCH